MEKVKARLVALFNAQVGYREGANNWNKYAAELDAIDGLTWGKKQNQPWCGEFKLWGFVKEFGAELALKMLYSPRPTSIPLCAAGAQYFKEAGQWFQKPQVGDVAFFTVNGGINHEGVVTAVGMGAFTTVEGNSSDMVARRTYSIGAPNVAGFGRPNWALAAAPETAADPSPDHLYHAYQYLVKINLLKLGDYGPQVRNVQLLLKDAGYDCSVNSEYDDATYTAVEAFQAEHGLETDGEFGGKTFEKLYNS